MSRSPQNPTTSPSVLRNPNSSVRPSSSSSTRNKSPSVELGSPMTSPVKVVQLVNMVTNGYAPSPARRDTQNFIQNSTITEEINDELGNRTITSIEENEVVGQFINPQDQGDVEMNGVDEHLDEDEQEDDEEGEAEGEGEEGEGSEEDDEEDDDDDDEDDDDEDDSGEESEDLGASPEIQAIDGPNGPPRLSLPPTVKLEPGTPGPSTIPADSTLEGEATTAVDGAEGETNVLVPKKKKRAKLRSPSEEEDLPPPPPPMKTIRLSRAMLPEGETLEWNILDDARDKGMIAEVWGIAEDPIEPINITIKEGEEENMDVDNPHPLPVDGGLGITNGHNAIQGENVAGPSSGPLFGLGFGDEDPEEIARRLEEKYGDEKTSKKAKKRKQVDYDLEDPFIDDSEILIDAPTHFARPKKEGFFVHSGALELLEESPVKPKPRTTKQKPRSSNPAPPPKEPRKSLSSAVRSHKRRGHTFKGSQAQPISIDDSDGERNGGPSRNHLQGSLSPPPERENTDGSDLDMRPVTIDRLRYKNASRDEKYLPPWPTFPVEVRRRLLKLRSESEQQRWDPNNRSRFPENLKVHLQSAGEAAYEHNMFGLGDREGIDKDFWHAVTSALPYNEFTIRKLCTKLCYQGYWRFLHDCEDEGIRQFGEMVEKDKEEVIIKHDEIHKKWEEEVKEWDEKHPSSQSNGTGSSTTAAAAISIDALVDGGIGTPNPNSTPKPDDASARPAEPTKRFPWTSDMREVFEQLVENMLNMVDLTVKASPGEWNISNAKQGKEWSETAIKQKMYKRIVEVFPDGYMNTSIISREMSRINKTKKAKHVEPEGETNQQ